MCQDWNGLEWSLILFLSMFEAWARAPVPPVLDLEHLPLLDKWTMDDGKWCWCGGWRCYAGHSWTPRTVRVNTPMTLFVGLVPCGLGWTQDVSQDTTNTVSVVLAEDLEEDNVPWLESLDLTLNWLDTQNLLLLTFILKVHSEIYKEIYIIHH